MMESKVRTWLKPTDQMDVWLDTRGFYRKHTARDASCLFRAVSEQIFLTQAHHTEVKRQILDYIMIHRRYFKNLINGPVEEYVDKIRNHRERGGPIEIVAMSLFYKVDFIMFKEIGVLGEAATAHGFKKRLMLCQSHEHHYDSVYTKDYIKDLAFCQSVLYEMLYKNVFKLKEVDYAVNKMLHDKAMKHDRELVPFYGHCFEDLRLAMRDSTSNVKELLDMGITPFPYKVAKSLDTEVYRNVEFDVWNDCRKGLKYGLCPWNSKELQVGVKCLVKINNSSYHGHIQEMEPNKGPVLVFILELGEKVSVPYESLELLPPPARTIPSPSTPSQLLPLQMQATSDLESMLKESVKAAMSGVPREENKEFTQETQVVCSSDYYEDDSEYLQLTYDNMFHQEDGTQEQVYPDSTEPVEQTKKSVRPVNLMVPRPYNPDGSDLPIADSQTLRFYYNVGLDHMRMNSYMIPSPYYVNPRVIPVTNYVAIDSPVTPCYDHPASVMAPVIEAGNNQHESAGSEAEAALPPRFKKQIGQANAAPRTSQSYEGQPLIQQYEVSSTNAHPAHHAPLYYQHLDCDSAPPMAPPAYAPSYHLVDYPPPPYNYPTPYSPIAYPPAFIPAAVEAPLYYHQPFIPHPPPL